MVVRCGMGGAPPTTTTDTTATAVVEAQCLETFVTRIGGPFTGQATFSPIDGPDPAPGNLAVVEPGYRAMSWRFLRSTEQDPGNGSIAQLRVGNVLFNAGSGPQYQENGWNVDTAAGEFHQTELEFEAIGEAFVEIIVVRNCDATAPTNGGTVTPMPQILRDNVTDSDSYDAAVATAAGAHPATSLPTTAGVLANVFVVADGTALTAPVTVEALVGGAVVATVQIPAGASTAAPVAATITTAAYPAAGVFTYRLAGNGTGQISDVTVTFDAEFTP